MRCAASLPAANASVTVAGPVTASPPAKTPGRLVVSVLGSTWIVLPLPMRTPKSSGVWGACPIAAIRVSNTSVNSLPLTGTGLCRPLSSGSPSFILIQVTFNLLLCLSILVGVTRYLMSIPSSSACSISAGSAGISVRVRRYRILTFWAPRRVAVRAASMATLPPPTTATFFPRDGLSPRLTSRRNVAPSITPGLSSPSILILRL